MIHVIATIELKEGSKDNFLNILHANVPQVRAERGCLAYQPTVDIDSGISVQAKLRPDVVTIMEAWESLADLHQHIKAPHMATYRDKVKDIVKQVTLQILQPV